MMRRNTKNVCGQSGRCRAVSGLVAALMLVGVGISVAAPLPEQKCQGARYLLAGKYSVCQAKAVAASQVSATYDLARALAKCRAKTTNTWPKLQIKYPGTSCAAPRFVDGGNGTVLDGLTGLQWEKKTGSVGPDIDCESNPCVDAHDVNNKYLWSSAGSASDGGAFTKFLAQLNDATAGCFAGACDWHLPTTAELMSIVDSTVSTCNPPAGVGMSYTSASTCIDQSVFGPTQGYNLSNAFGAYWSSATVAPSPTQAYCVTFSDGGLCGGPKDYIFQPVWVRAVRGGM